MNAHFGGPLAGVRIIEMAGIGPAPFAGMMLADHGAEVIRVCRPGTARDPHDVLSRSRRSIVLNMKNPRGVEIARRLIGGADGLIEGFRPGVMERLGLGPAPLLGAFPRLVYGRMTGWGQTGPLAPAAGHDINYIALTGALHAIGRAGQKPTPPINLVADFGGGGMLLAFGMVSALLHARSTGEGQVIDCAMTDGSALLMAMIWGFRAAGSWRDERGANLLDTGAHFYDSYETADGRFVAIGAIEPQFYGELCRRLGISDPDFDGQNERANWPRLREKLAAVIRTRTRDDWCRLLEGEDACFAPVLSMAEAPRHPHNAERGTFVFIDGTLQPAPAPRFSVTPAAPPRRPPTPAADTSAILGELGYSRAEIDELLGVSAAYVD
jgi:alpha-methylacyl-CoA racemase